MKSLLLVLAPRIDAVDIPPCFSLLLGKNLRISGVWIHLSLFRDNPNMVGREAPFSKVCMESAAKIINLHFFMLLKSPKLMLTR